METHNPYETPATDLAAAAPSSKELYTPAMIEHLRATKPWVRFLSILGFVLCGLIGLGGLAATAISAIAAATSEFGDMLPALFAGLFYLLFAGLGFIPLIPLHRYANAIGFAVAGGGAPAIEDALMRQRSFWRIIGIVMIVFIGLQVLAVLAIMAVAVFAAIG